MRVTVLARGGLSVYGGHYDPHANEAVVLIREDETVALTIEYPTAPTSPSKTTDGLACSTPAVSSLKLTATLTGINDGGYADISATVGGVIKTVRVRARSTAQTDGYDD